MLYRIYAITVKDLKVLFHDRGALINLFAMPVVFILIMSAAGVGGVHTDNNPINVLIVNQDAGDLGARAIGELRKVNGLALVEAVDGVKLTRDVAERRVERGMDPVAVIVPRDFSERIRTAATDAKAPQAVVTFVADPATTGQLLRPIEGTVEGFIERTAAYAQAPRQIGATFEQLARQVPPAQAPVVQQIGKAFVERMANGGGLAQGANAGVRFEQRPPGKIVVRRFPDPAEQNVPGYTIFGVFFIVQALAVSLLREKQDGSFRRLLAAPLPQATMLIGKLVPYYLVNLIQVVSMFAIGVLVFGMKLDNAPAALVVVTLALAAAATGMGLLVAALSKTPEQAGGVAALLSIGLAAIGGMMFPTFVMPQFMQTLARVTPHAWALAGYQDVIVRGLGVSAVLPGAGVLLAFAAVFFGFALWRFRFE